MAYQHSLLQPGNLITVVHYVESTKATQTTCCKYFADILRNELEYISNIRIYFHYTKTTTVANLCKHHIILIEGHKTIEDIVNI